MKDYLDACKVCGKPIPEVRRRHHAKYCSRECSLQNQGQLYRQSNPLASILPPGTRGMIAEYRVALNLLERGYEVFRALSPSQSCDLAILKNNVLTRIEVRTGYLTASGNPNCNKKHRADILAIVLCDSIVYQPELG